MMLKHHYASCVHAKSYILDRYAFPQLFVSGCAAEPSADAGGASTALVPSVVVGDEPSAGVAGTSTALVGTSSAPVPSVGLVDHDVDMRTEIDLTLSDAGDTARADSVDRLSTLPLSPGALAVAVGA